MSAGFETLLGAAQQRYFGHGYRKTRYDLSDLRPDRLGGGALQATASVTYAADWSMKAGAVRTPHLSTLDAIVLTASLAQAHLSGLGLSRDAIASAWIQEVFIKGGSRPVVDLKEIPLHVHVAGSCPAQRPGWARTVLEIGMGTLSVTAIVEHEEGPKRRRHSHASRAAAPMPEVFGELFRMTDHRVRVTHVDLQDIRCQVEFTPRHAEPTGLESAYWPSATLIDGVVVAGQMLQVALSGNSQRNRDASTNMWIRKLRIQAPPPRHPSAGGASLTVSRFRIIEREHTTYLVCDTDVSVTGVRMRASAAQTYPSTRARAPRSDTS